MTIVVLRTTAPRTVDNRERIIVTRTAQGPMGLPGRDGADGLPGDGATDPGDLTLIFANKLI